MGPPPRHGLARGPSCAGSSPFMGPILAPGAAPGRRHGRVPHGPRARPGRLMDAPMTTLDLDREAPGLASMTARNAIPPAHAALLVPHALPPATSWARSLLVMTEGPPAHEAVRGASWRRAVLRKAGPPDLHGPPPVAPGRDLA